MHDPLREIDSPFVIRAEHLGRYLFASRICKMNKIETVYDIACGNGYGVSILAKGTRKVIGLDRSREFIDQAKKHYPGENSEYHPFDANSQTVSLFMKQKKLPPADAIVSFETLEHLINPDQFINQCYENLKKQGLLILSVPNSQFEPKRKGRSRNKYHLHLFSREKISSLLRKNGFVVKSVYGQPLANFFQHKARFINPIFEKMTKNNRRLFLLMARLFGGPMTIFSDYSYSIVIVAVKK